MSFKIQISVETSEELVQSLSKVGRDLDAGKFPAVVNELTYLSWEHMLSIFTPEGQAIMEDFRRRHEVGPDAIGGDFIGLLSESTHTNATLEEINEATSQRWSETGKDKSTVLERPATKEVLQKVAASSSSIKVADLNVFDPADYINDAEDVMLYLKDTLAENNPISLAEALKVILRSDGINKLIGISELGKG
ncbi:DNA-binding protein [Methylophilus sp. Leaf408]|mgnify:CR=1 FL=1|uniref:helix-turn-helix domain-containing transcriptional regulator n=1 Tax=Methylophilus sp. Leaf408 TaxID=2876561 RepID=UPI001E43E530|nr:hypothetical protein [Methylophilus sp. Leaf408]